MGRRERRQTADGTRPLRGRRTGRTAHARVEGSWLSQPPGPSQTRKRRCQPTPGPPKMTCDARGHLEAALARATAARHTRTPTHTHEPTSAWLRTTTGSPPVPGARRHELTETTRRGARAANRARSWRRSPCYRVWRASRGEASRSRSH